MNVTTPAGRVLSDRYEIEGLLGAGGMASVWRGRDLRLDRPVAIKELAGPWLGDRDALQRFDREARMAARLAHPNIMAVYDVGVHADTPYLVMELIEGTTVARLLAEGPMPIDTTVALAAQACDGLAAAHAAGVIHRDIKPANLMVTDAAVLKICDFGIARALSGIVDATATGPAVAIGTSRYMSPEQASGDRVDGRADLYALGCTLYTMLAGTPPFRGTVAEVLHQHTSQAPEPLRVYRTDLPEPLEALVLGLLAKDPDHRPTCADAKAVLAQLAPGAVLPKARGAAPVRVRPVTAPVPPPRRTARYWPLAVVGVVVVLLVATASLWMRGKESGQPSGALIPTTTPSTAAAAATPPPVPTSTQPIAAQPSRSPASATAQPSSPAPATDPIAALRLAVQQQVSTGNLNPDKASDLYTKVDAIAHAAFAGNTADVAKNVKAFQDRITALRTGGQLSASGYDVLKAAADAISATLP